jgi:hypothetical protein
MGLCFMTHITHAQYSPDQITIEDMRDVEGIAFPNSETGQLDLSYINMSESVAPGSRLILYNTPLKSQFQK